jgi:O-antigen/teichoic acid export membrane protein
MIAESVLKISLAILLVLIGLGTYGAIGGVAIGIFLAFFVSFLVIKEILKVKRQKANLRGISSYSFSVTLVILAIVLMYSLDIILARGFLPAEAAGEYAAISMLGKIIFFGTLPMSKAMFPISSEKFESGKETSRIFKKSLTIVILLCLLALLAFILIPGFIVKVWTHGKILNTPLIVLFFVGLALSLLSLTNLIVMYCFSINRIKNTWWLFLFVLLEVVLLAIFHSSVMQFSLAFLAANVLMFLNSLLIIKTS